MKPDPPKAMSDFWDERAAENAISAICYHATPAEFEKRGKHDAEYLARVMSHAPQALAGGDISGMTVLDIGGGIGRIAKWLAPQVRDYHLLDVSAEMLSQAREYLGDLVGAQKSPAVHLHKGDGYHIGLPRRSVNFAFCDLVLQHMDQEVAVNYLLELRQVLGPNCWAFVHVPAQRYPDRFLEAARGDWPGNLHRWPPGDFLEMVVRLGWQVIAADLASMQFVLQNPPAVLQAQTAPWGQSPAWGQDGKPSWLEHRHA